MCENRIKMGDTVQLKSGGPLMTVTMVEEGDAVCSWIDKAGEPKEERYPMEALIKGRRPRPGDFVVA